MPDTPPEGLVPATAACVTVRLLGDVVGRGEEVAATAAPGVVWRAARKAVDDLRKKLPVADDALADERRREFARQATVTLELGGTLVPIREQTYDEIDEAVSPGMFGFAARAGERLVASFPSESVVAGTLPGQSVATLVGQVLGDPAKGLRIDPEAQPAKVMARDGVGLFRFAVSPIGQPTPNEPGAFLTRGGRVIGIGIVSTKSLRAMGEGIAKHLLKRVHEAKHEQPFMGFRGVYFPARGVHDPDVAPAAEQAMVAFALASWGQRTGGDNAHAAASMWLGGAFAEGSLVRISEDARAATLALAAGAAATRDGTNPMSREALDACVAAIKANPSPDDAGLLILALSVSASGRETAAQLADTLYMPDERGQRRGLAAHMPWVVLAERKLGGGRVRESSVAALRDFRERAYGFTLSAVDAARDDVGEDLAGGIVFPGSRPPLPTAQSLRVIAALAAMLADPGVTPDEEFQRELVRIMPGLRYLRQLCADEWTMPLCREPSRAAWGVRAATWDARMPGEASALGLVTLRETLDAIERRASTPEAPKP
jgi:hypothetical protein